MDEITPTKQRILICAVDLFAAKGYTEASVRDIAMAANIKPASLYNYFPSKENILAFIVNDYVNNAKIMSHNLDLPYILHKNPTAEGMLNCLQLNFSVYTDDYYLKVLRVLYNEHHRNEDVRKVFIKFILSIEENVRLIFGELKKLNVIRQDADSNIWEKIVTSLTYALVSRIFLGIGLGSPTYTGMNLAGSLHYVFDLILKTYGVANDITDNQAI